MSDPHRCHRSHYSSPESDDLVGRSVFEFRTRSHLPTDHRTSDLLERRRLSFEVCE